MKPRYTLYEMEPLGVDGALEANGVVYYFCCGSHLDRYRSEHYGEAVYNSGIDGEPLDGTVCDFCGKEIEGLTP